MLKEEEDKNESNVEEPVPLDKAVEIRNCPGIIGRIYHGSYVTSG